MIVYKYISLEKFHRTVDLLMSQRIYCPVPSELNDPLEGVLGVGAPVPALGASFEEKFESSARFWFAADDLLNQYRICSFSKTPNHPLMWAYYGNGHSGICLECDISAYQGNIVPVEYVKDLAVIDQSSIRSLLKYKLEPWAHEEEVRIIIKPANGEKFIQAKITSVLVGGRLDPDYIKPLFRLCKTNNLKVELLTFNTAGESSRFPLNVQAIS